MSTKVELLEAIEGLIIVIEGLSKDPGMPDEAKAHLVKAAGELCHVSVTIFTKG
jgi:hypothetical protein